jgi:hypothetical protein
LLSLTPTVFQVQKRVRRKHGHNEATRKRLEAQARRLDIRARSKMGKAELKRAVARAR